MSRRILIIDDDESIRRAMRLTLESVGYDVGEASDGVSALEAYKDGSTWDAVLLDQRMPGMDGLRTLRHIKKRRPGARVVMATAFPSIALAVNAMTLGATDSVLQPISPVALRNAVHLVLDRPEFTDVEITNAPDIDKTQAWPRPPHQTIIINGFEIIPARDETARSPSELMEHRFIVRNPDGEQYEVIVEIDEEAVSYVDRMTRRHLPADGSFWAMRAERFLSDYLWNEGSPPLSGRLKLTEVDRDELMRAERWKDH